MGLTKYKIGELIEIVDERNNLGIRDFFGININKEFMPTVANTEGSSSSLCKAVSSATLSCGAGVLIIVDHLASGGKLYVPSAKVASSKNAALMFSSSGSNPCSLSVCFRFSIPSSYFSPINLKNTSVSIISLFSKNEPELRAARK